MQFHYHTLAGLLWEVGGACCKLAWVPIHSCWAALCLFHRPPSLLMSSLMTVASLGPPEFLPSRLFSFPSRWRVLSPGSRWGCRTLPPPNFLGLGLSSLSSFRFLERPSFFCLHPFIFLRSRTVPFHPSTVPELNTKGHLLYFPVWCEAKWGP